MHRYNSDSMGTFPLERDIYNVRTLPHECFPRPHVKKYIPPSQEQLEREFFGRLQGYSGNLSPIIGKMARILLWVIFFPLFGVQYLFRKLKGVILRAIAYFTPYAYLLLDWDRRLANKVFKQFKFVEIQLNKVSQAWLKFRYWVYANTYLPFETKSQLFISRIAKRLQPLGKFYLKIRNFRLPLPTVILPNWKLPNLEIKESKVIYKINYRFLRFGLFVETKINYLRLRIYRLRIWTNVLTTYANRVLSDWILEIKQWFR